MSLSPDTILQAVDLVKKAVEIYRRIEDLPAQMTALGRRLEQLGIFLGCLARFVKAKPKTAYDGLLASQKGELEGIMKSIKSNIDSAYDFFERYEKGILSRRYDIQFRFKWAAQVWFSLAENTPEKVGALVESIDNDCTFLNHYLALMNAQGIEHLINKDKKGGRSVSPLPRTDYTIIFIDPYNQGRSVIAAAWVYTFMACTLKAGAQWRIKHCHAAGFFVKSRSDCIETIDGLDYTYKSFKKPFKDGGAMPDRNPRAALFDSQQYNYPDKKLLEDKVASWRSRGVRSTIFKDYDYIVVFTNREIDNMTKLRNALIKQEGPSVAPRGKGKLLMLGAHLSPPAEILAPAEIPNAAKNKNGTKNGDHWNKTVAQLKLAIKEFLFQEFQWAEPEDIPCLGDNI